MTSNKTNDKQKLDCDGDGLFTGGRAEMVEHSAVNRRVVGMCVKKIRCSLRDVPVIGPYRARSDLGLSRRF